MSKKNCRITCMADGCNQPIDGSFFSQILALSKFDRVYGRFWRLRLERFVQVSSLGHFSSPK
jgi:hypothetical protein